MFIQGKFKSYRDDLSDVYAIRREVFIEEQHKTEKQEFDSYDKDAIFCVLYEENPGSLTECPVATGRLVKLEDGRYKIGRIAVRKESRGKQYGDMLVKMLVNKAFDHGSDKVYVSAQVKAKGFYQTIGFKEYGSIFMEAGMPHIDMVLEKSNLCKKCKEFD